MHNPKLFDVQATWMTAQVGLLTLKLLVATDEDLKRLGNALVCERHMSLLDLPWIHIGSKPITLRVVRRSSDIREYLVGIRKARTQTLPLAQVTDPEDDRRQG